MLNGFATNPLILRIDNTGVSIAKPQVVLNKSLNSLSLVPELTNRAPSLP